MSDIYSNTSGQGKQAVVPSEISGWNWGAFLLNWIWGIGNNTLVALLTFVPFIGFFVPFVLGFKGSEWAWRNKKWDSVDHFKRTQKRWAFWGFVLMIAFLLAFILSIAGIFLGLKRSDVHQLALERVRSNPTIIASLGNPIEAGWMTSGNMKVNGASGSADLSIPIHGPSGKGKVYLKATKKMNAWTFDSLQVKVDGQENPIDLLATTKENLPGAAPTSQADLQSAIQTSLQNKDRASFLALYDWTGVSDNMKNQQNQIFDMIFNNGYSSVETQPLPADFKDEYILNGVHLRANVKIIGVMTLTGGGQSGPVNYGPIQIPYGTKDGKYFLSNTIEEPVAAPIEKDVSLNISVAGTPAVKFSGYFVYIQAGQDVHEEIKGKGNKSIAVRGERVKYAAIRKTSKSGQLWLKVLEDGKVIFKSKKTSSRRSIIYEAK